MKVFQETLHFRVKFHKSRESMGLVFEPQNIPAPPGRKFEFRHFRKKILSGAVSRLAFKVVRTWIRT